MLAEVFSFQNSVSRNQYHVNPSAVLLDVYFQGALCYEIETILWLELFCRNFSGTFSELLGTCRHR